MMHGHGKTLSEVASLIGVPPVRAWKWASEDSDFHDLLSCVRQVIADRLEKELSEEQKFIPAKMMILKGYRPMFRDRQFVEHSSEGLRNLLAELQAARHAPIALPMPQDEDYVEPDFAQVVEDKPMLAETSK